MALVVPAARSEEKKHVKVVRSVTAKALAAEQEVLLNKEVEEIQIEENYIEEQKEESVIVEQKQQKQAADLPIRLPKRITLMWLLIERRTETGR